MIFRSNPSSGVPVYLQLIEQVKHAVDVGSLRPGDQLPTIRRVAEDLVINPNTVAKAYRDLEHEGVIELRHGAGAFVTPTDRQRRVEKVKAGQPVLRGALDRLLDAGLTPDEIRRLCEAELLRLTDKPRARK
ncbi:MAG TPA: GntR family transcriptional regulator [Vicinamibacterales bacterium]|nr:GntR family transcriptional regulator [Vicinamibacterales bacterium]